MSSLEDDYADMRLRPIAFPAPERIGSWWRWRWTFLVTKGGRRFRLPPPTVELDLQMLVSCWWEDDSLLVLECHTRDDKMTGDELTYVTIAAAWLRISFPEAEILVQGVHDHPILRMSQLPPELIQYFRGRGY